MLSIIVGALGFGFTLMAVVMIFVSLIRGKRALSGQVVPLQQIHETLSPGLKNTVEVVEDERKQQDESHDKRAGPRQRGLMPRDRHVQ